MPRERATSGPRLCRGIGVRYEAHDWRIDGCGPGCLGRWLIDRTRGGWSIYDRLSQSKVTRRTIAEVRAEIARLWSEEEALWAQAGEEVRDAA